MDYTQSLPLVRFSRESGWNPVEMWLLGATDNITGHTDANNVAHTIKMFQQAHQQPKFCADKNGRVVDCNSPERVQGGATGGRNNPIYGDQTPSQPPDNSGDWRRDTIWTDGNGNIVPEGTPGAIPSDMWSRGAGIVDTLTSNADNWFKRVVLALAAIVIIAIGVASLR